MYYFLVTNNGRLTDIPSNRSGSIEDIRRYACLFLKVHRSEYGCTDCKIYKAGQKKSIFIGDVDIMGSSAKWMGSAKGSYLYALKSNGSLGERYLNRRS